MHALGLKCTSCEWSGDLNLRYECPLCGSPLEVFYDYDQVDRAKVDRALREYRGLWDFRELLPLRDSRHIVSLHEGGTPLIRSELPMKCQAFWKDETRNPTLSFKDRPNTVGISMAREQGFEEISIASTGNGGASLSAYAARAKMPCHVCVPESTPPGKVVQQMYHGASIVLCKGDYSDSYQHNRLLSQAHHWANMTSTYLNPFTMEGDKTIAYEIFSQLGRSVPDWIAVPLGAGAMLTGILKGFEELCLLGFADRLPRMMGVQAEGCAPIVDAWIRGEEHVNSWPRCSTIAGAIADPLTGYEKDGDRTLNSIHRSNGCGIRVRDEEILRAVRDLAAEDAMFVEPASASVAAAINQAVEKGLVKEQEVAVGILTAHGLKDVEQLAGKRKGTEI